MIGQSVGPYRIQSQLGQGGMGVVYKAHDERLDRTVALKFLPPQLSSDERARQRFIQEARAASALDHANICTIHDIGQTEDGQVYIVMAFYSGQTLKYRLEDGALPEDEAVDIVLQAARGLARAHEAGIVHRDVKPANIMVTQRGEVKILDFGVAKLAESMDLTREGSTIGTAAYMSPEQARGEAVDPRSDQWSLGILLYELLSGRRPFGGGYDAAMVYAILNEDPPDVATLRPDIDPAVAAVVRKLLSKRPDDRYATTDALVRALEIATGASGSGVTAAAPPAPSGAEAASTGRITVVFGVIAALTLVVVYAAMHFFGLPDWVFTFGVLLMAVGLPILILAGALERRRASLDSGERSTLTGIPAWLTVRKAALGGVAAMVLLSLASGGYMAMRAMGIGPAGTLVSKGTLAERDFVVVADFDNRTNDPNLGLSITEAFRIDLSQSSIVNLVDAGTIRDALERMQRDPDSPLDGPAAREVAERVGAKAVIVGEIASIGRSFQLVGRMIGVSDGAELVAMRENAADDGALLEAIDRLSGRLRERIGESLVTIRGGVPLEDVSTASLPALRLYSEADAAADGGEYAESEALLLQALAIDSTFAMAWRKLAVVRGNSGAPMESRNEAARRAFALRDRLTEREGLLAEANYYNYVVPDQDRLITLYESLLERWPDDLAALNNLALAYNARNRPADAERLLRHAVEIGEGVVFRTNLIDALALQNKWDQAEAALQDYIDLYPRESHPWMWRARIAAKRSDFETARALLDSAEARVRDFTDVMGVRNTRSTIAETEGRYAEASSIEAEHTRALAERGYEAPQIVAPLYLHYQRSLVTDDRAGMRATLDRLLAEHPLSSLNVRTRPDPFVAGAYAWTGDPDRGEAVLARWREEVPPELRPNPPYTALALIASARGESRRALDLLDSLRMSENCPQCAWDMQGHLLLRMDSLRAASVAYERFLADSSGFGITEEEGPVRLRLAGIYQDLGDLDQAIRNYARFVSLWSGADPDLQPYVRRAQAEMDRLLDLQAREPDRVPSTSGP